MAASRVVAGIAFSALLGACGGAAGSGGDVSDGAAADHEGTVPVTVAGTVRTLLPLAGAVVSVGLAQEDDAPTKLASGLTTQDGAFSVHVGDVPADGTLFIDADAGAGLFLRAIVPVSEIAEKRPVAVDAWSTLAACLGETYMRQGALGDADWGETSSLAAERIGAHLARPDSERSSELPAKPESVKIPWVEAMNPCDDDVPWPSPQALSGLALAGLQEVALAADGNGGSSTATLRLVSSLCTDLGDGVFDGKAVGGDDGDGAAGDGARSGEVIVLAGAPLDPEATRLRLAEGIHQAVSGGCDCGKPDIGLDLAAKGGLYEDIARDSSVLYPTGVPPVFDPLPPTVEVKAVTPADGENVCMKSPIWASASDNLGLTSLKLLGPAGFPEATGDLSSDTTTALLKAEVDPSAMPEEGMQEFMIVATDIVGNQASQARSLVLDSNDPVIVKITPPLDECAALVPEFYVVDATDLGSGVAAVEVRIEEGPLNCENIGDDSWSCSGPPMLSGQDVRIIVTDECSRKTEVKGTICVK